MRSSRPAAPAFPLRLSFPAVFRLTFPAARLLLLLLLFPFPASVPCAAATLSAREMTLPGQQATPSARETPLSGRVLGSDGETLPGANIVAYTEDGRILKYTTTDTAGCFRFDIPAAAARITVTYIGYHAETVRVQDLKNPCVFTLREEAFSLREVVVRAERISESGDTLTYSVSSFREAQDRNIADVIGRMPGIEVKSDGTIEYQGKAISNCYIEGLDLMGGQYSLASNNIPAEKIKSVQVLENHQRIKSLKGTGFSEQAALNLVLQDDARAVWSGLAGLGAGYAGQGEGALYDNRIMGMQFSKKFQTLMMYKNNNTGTDIGEEVTDIADLGGYQAENGLIGLPEIGGPAFEEQRYSFNASHLLAANLLLKTGRDSDIRLQLSGFHDRERLRSERSTAYLSIDGMPVVTEDYGFTSRKNEIKGELCYTLNSDRTYVRSSTKVYADWNSGNGEMRWNGNSTDLMVRPYKRMLSEDLNISRTTARGDVWQVNSSTGDTYLPGRLLILDGTARVLDLDLFSTRNGVSYSRRIRNHFFKNTLGFDGRRQQINGVLWQNLQPYWEPSAQMTFGSHQLSGSVKSSFAYQTYEGKSSGHIWIEPSFSWEWKASPKSELSFRYRRSAMPYEGTDIIDTPLFTDYRTVYEGNGRTGERFSDVITAGYAYRNPVNGIFFNIRPVYIHSSGNIVYESTMDSDTCLRRATDRTYDADTYIVGSRLAKSFLWHRLRIGLGGSIQSTGYAYLQGTSVRDARINVCSISLDYSVRPFQWCTMEGKSAMRTSSRNRSGRITDWSHFLDFHLSSGSGWIFSIDNELYHSSDRGFGLNYFCDLSLGYRKDRWEISLLANNIAGTSEYRHVSVTATTQSYTLTYLRPREILLEFSIGF